MIPRLRVEALSDPSITDVSAESLHMAHCAKAISNTNILNTIKAIKRISLEPMRPTTANFNVKL